MHGVVGTRTLCPRSSGIFASPKKDCVGDVGAVGGGGTAHQLHPRLGPVADGLGEVQGEVGGLTEVEEEVLVQPDLVRHNLEVQPPRGHVLHTGNRYSVSQV